MMNTPDRLEQFIRTHRESLDDQRAPAHLWHRIDRELHPGEVRVHRMWRWAAVAASGLILLMSGYLIGTRTPAAPPIAGWSEYQETECYYQTRIAQKMDEIKQVGAEPEVLADMQMLDEVYQDLRRQLFDDPNADPQWILSAMIRHQQQKLEIMEKILTHIDKYKPNEKQLHPM